MEHCLLFLIVIVQIFLFLMYVCESFVIYIFFTAFISTSIYHWANISHGIKVLMKVIKTEMINVGFTSK